MLEDSQAEAMEVSAEKKSLQDSLNAILHSQKDLEKEISDLTNEVVSAADVSFEWAKGKVLFLYPTLDMVLLDPFKFVKGGVMVDKEKTTFPELKPFPLKRKA